MTEPPRRRLETFVKLCGSDLPEKVILATSMWDLVTEDEGLERERQLQSKYWGRRGANIMARYGKTSDREGARRVVDKLLAGGLS